MTMALDAGTGLVEYGRRVGLFATPPSRPSTIERLSDTALIAEFVTSPSHDVRLAEHDWTSTPLVTPIGTLEAAPFDDFMRAAEGTPASRGFYTFSPSGAAIGRAVYVAPYSVKRLLQGRTTELRPERRPAFDLEGAVAEIRAIAGISVAEFTDMLGRSRERYYAWRKGPVPAEIVARISAIRDALATLASEPAHLVRGWLHADGGAATKLLASEDYQGFAAASQAWLASRRPRVARRVMFAEVEAISGEDVAGDDEERLARFRAMVTTRFSPPPVARAPNFYRDVLGATSDEDE